MRRTETRFPLDQPSQQPNRPGLISRRLQAGGATGRGCRVGVPALPDWGGNIDPAHYQLGNSIALPASDLALP